jgi:hypothetical protein
MLARAALQGVRSIRDFVILPVEAKRMWWRDRTTPLGADPGPAAAFRGALDWLCEAQDRSLRKDGGVARHYSLTTGWGASYPETTGYIVPTFLEAARHLGDEELRGRARRMLDWLVSIQREDGGFQGGTVDARPAVSVTFNTGQILLGLAAGVSEWGDRYRLPMQRAANWLIETQDPDGAWRRHPTPFARRGEKAYETHVAWGLLEAARLEPGRRYAQSALRNIEWALTRQRPNGWFSDCCLNDPVRPLTHTLGYVLRGVLEGHRFSADSRLLEAGALTADALLRCQRADGSLPGRLDETWSPAADWVCLTGSAQIALCWHYLHHVTGKPAYREAALRGTAFVRRTMILDGDPGIRGGVKGSYPASGGYGRFELLNWAAKFLADACLVEPTGPGQASVPVQASRA